MILKKWEDLPESLKTEEVRPYYDILKKKKLSLFFKRLFDIALSFIMLIILSPLFLFIAIAIKLDSEGPVFYRQERANLNLSKDKHLFGHKYLLLFPSP